MITLADSPYEPKPVPIPVLELAQIVEESGATLREGCSPDTFATELAFYAEFLTQHPQALDAGARNLAILTASQRKALQKLRDSLEAASNIFSSTEDAEWIAGRRWLLSLNNYRRDNSWQPFLVEETQLLLTQMHLSATYALNFPDDYFRHYVLPLGSTSNRILKEKGEDYVREIIEDARDFMKCEPKTRSILLIGRAISCHIQDSLLGVVPRINAMNRDKGIENIPQGATIRLGQAIARRWGIEGLSGDALRTDWRKLPQRRSPRSGRAIE